MFQFIFILIFALAISQVENSPIGMVLITALFLAVIMGLFFFGIHIKKKREIKDRDLVSRAKRKIDEITNSHIRTLSSKFDQLVREDDYGNVDFDKWMSEVKYFIDNVIIRDESISDYLSAINVIDKSKVDDVRQTRMIDVNEQITNLVLGYKKTKESIADDLGRDTEALSATEFEHHCARILRLCGWDARVTPPSGDQGVDIVATIGGIKAVFQCKKYAKPVGNSAVQQIVAGKAHEKADYAAVITNSTYTASAKQLASTNGVFLLHDSELDEFSNRLVPERGDESKSDDTVSDSLAD